MKIKMPRKFDIKSSIKFSIDIDNIKDDKEYYFDYSGVRVVEPFGMLLISSKVREFYKKHSNSRILVTGSKNMPYAFAMGFFDSIDEQFSDEPDVDDVDSFIPITEINIKIIKKEAEINFDGNIEAYLRSEVISPIVNIFSISDSKIVENIYVVILHIINNVIEHSGSESFWIAAQKWSHRDIVEFAVYDNGIGIRKSLELNKLMDFRNKKDALKLAIRPGITKVRKTFFNKNPKNINGLGLYLASNICGLLGDFVLCSNDLALIRKDNFYSFEKASFNGTIIRLRFNLGELDKINATKEILLDESKRIIKKVQAEKQLSLDVINRIDNKQIIEKEELDIAEIFN